MKKLTLASAASATLLGAIVFVASVQTAPKPRVRLGDGGEQQ